MNALHGPVAKRRFALLPSGAEPAATYLLTSRGLRAFGDGLVSLLLPAYLAALGFNAFEIGVLATATLAGSAGLTLAVGFVAHHFSRRSLLIAAAVLMVVTGIAFALVHDFWPLLIIAFVGTLNPSSGDVSVFLPLEHAQLAHSVTDRDRTALFARYSLVGSLVGAVGALAAGVPDLLRQIVDLDIKQALQIAFLLYAFLGVGALLLYRQLPDEPLDASAVPAEPLRKSRAIVLTLAALFSLEAAGAIFSCTGVLSAVPYLMVCKSPNGSGS
jgi:MFS family permease